MKRKLQILLIISGIVMSSVHAQSPREILTNAKIIEMIRQGLDEEIIVEKIRQSECRCETTTEALAKLKAAKVSKPVIMAMLESSSGNQSLTQPQENNKIKVASSEKLDPQGNRPEKLPPLTEPGIYVFENNEMKMIEPSVFSGTKANFLVGGLTYGIKKSKFKAKVRGKSANMQISSAKPVFYFVFNPEYKNSGATMAGLFWGMPATSPAEFLMIQMSPKEASREAVMGEYGAFTGISMGARDKDIREYSFEKIQPGIYKVVPKENLVPGEYCLYYAANVTGIGFAGGKIFDFTVVSNINNKK